MAIVNIYRPLSWSYISILPPGLKPRFLKNYPIFTSIYMLVPHFFVFIAYFPCHPASLQDNYNIYNASSEDVTDVLWSWDCHFKAPRRALYFVQNTTSWVLPSFLPLGTCSYCASKTSRVASYRVLYNLRYRMNPIFLTGLLLPRLSHLLRNETLGLKLI